MTTFISRDFNPSSSGYLAQSSFGGSWGTGNTGRFYVNLMYELTVFLNKILGYTVVGQTSWDIRNTNVKSLIITAATNTTPIQITTSAAHGLTDGYVVSIAGGTGNTGVNGTWKVSVVNTTQATLYGTFGTGTYNANTATMTTGFIYASGLVADGYGAGINFGAGFLNEVAIPVAKKSVVAADVGRMLVLKSNAYPTKNAGCFKISSINAGNTTTIASGSNGAALPQATINVVSTTGFPTSGTFFVTTGTTIAAGSNGASLPQGTINVASTSGFPTSGTIFVVTSLGTQTVTYTGTNATQFTGCLGGTGVMSTGGSVTNGSPVQTITYTGTNATQFTGCSGGVGTLATGAPVTNLNRYVIDYRSTEAPPVEPANSIDWWLYENEVIASGYLSKFNGGSLNLSNVLNTTPITVATDSNFPHTWVTGQKVSISGNVGASTTIAAGSNGQSLPQATINVASTTNFPTSGTINVVTSAGTQSVTYTGLNAGTQFTGCSGGTGTMSTGGSVSITSNANGTFTITQVNAQATQFTLNGTVSSGATGAVGTAALVGYPGGPAGGAAVANSRIILQSPHASGWQIRIAAEPTNNNLPNVSFTVGYAGNSAGDFPPGSAITNMPEFLDVNPTVTSAYLNTVVGGGHVTTASRMTMMGDGYGQSVFLYTRTLGATNNGMVMFGIPDNEPVPTPVNANRLFCYGGAPVADSGTIILRTGSTLNVGAAIGNGNPQFGALTGWANLDGTSATSPLLSANAGDSPFTSTTEILPIEIWGGITADLALTGAAVAPFFYDQRFMGTASGLRNGRTNFATFSLSTDDVATRTISAATNASPIQITTSTTNGLTTGQTVTISGVTGNTAANGTFTITVVNNSNFTLDGSTGNGTFSNPVTTIAAGSNGATLPQATINVASTTGFATSGTIYVNTSTGVSTVNYTGLSGGTQFTGCTGGTGVMSTGGAVTTSFVNGCARWLHTQNGIYMQWNGASGLNP